MVQALQTKQAITNIQQEKDNLFSKIPKEIINTDLMKAIQTYGVFISSEPTAFDNDNSNIAVLK